LWLSDEPWTCLVFLPATGVVSTVLPVFARRPIVGYKLLAWSTVSIGFTGFAVWILRLLAVPPSASAFGIAHLTTALLFVVQAVAWLATLWHGRPITTTAYRFTLASVALFGLGALATVAANAPFRAPSTEAAGTVLGAASLFPAFAALYYWWPKITGRLPNDRVGAWSFWISLAGFGAVLLPVHIATLAVAGSSVFGFGVSLGLLNLLVSARRGLLAGPNPWNADSPEWTAEEPSSRRA
jgi:cytochrome c oxidase subunit I+III